LNFKTIALFPQKKHPSKAWSNFPQKNQKKKENMIFFPKIFFKNYIYIYIYIKTTVPLSKRKEKRTHGSFLSPKNKLWKPQLQTGSPFYKREKYKSDFCALSNTRD
jgi:hypothetical protein